jgi:3D (Asp-Asp-Asp) domain-containing protein
MMRVYRRKFWGFVLAALLLIGLPAGADAAEGRALYVTATAYSAQDPGNSAYTASGTLVRHGVIAVDPSVIPLGSRVFIPGYGEAVAEDIGWGIQGYMIDVAFDTYEEALMFGRQNIEIYLLE